MGQGHPDDPVKEFASVVRIRGESTMSHVSWLRKKEIRSCIGESMVSICIFVLL